MRFQNKLCNIFCTFSIASLRGCLHFELHQAHPSYYPKTSRHFQPTWLLRSAYTALMATKAKSEAKNLHNELPETERIGIQLVVRWLHMLHQNGISPCG